MEMKKTYYIEREIKKNVENSKFSGEDAEMLENFSKILDKELREHNINQEEFCTKIGISSGSLSHYRNGLKFPQGNIIIKIARELNCSTDYLLGLTNLKSIEKDLKIVHEVTGLSDVAIEHLKMIVDSYKNMINFEPDIDYKTNIQNDEVIRILNYFLETSRIDFFNEINTYLFESERLKNTFEYSLEHKGENFFRQHKSELRDEIKKSTINQKVAKDNLNKILELIEKEIKSQNDLKNFEIYLQ